MSVKCLQTKHFGLDLGWIRAEAWARSVVDFKCGFLIHENG